MRDLSAVSTEISVSFTQRKRAKSDILIFSSKKSKPICVSSAPVSVISLTLRLEYSTSSPVVLFVKVPMLLSKPINIVCDMVFAFLPCRLWGYRFLFISTGWQLISMDVLAVLLMLSPLSKLLHRNTAKLHDGCYLLRCGLLLTIDSLTSDGLSWLGLYMALTTLSEWIFKDKFD